MPMLSGGNFLKAEFVKSGDTLVFLNGGEFVESSFKNPALKQDGTPHPMAGQPKNDLIFKVSVAGVKYDFRMNITNQNALKEKYGRNTDDWKNKICKIDVCKVSVSGKMRDSILLTPIGEAQDVEQTTEHDEGPEDISWGPDQ